LEGSVNMYVLNILIRFPEDFLSSFFPHEQDLIRNLMWAVLPDSLFDFVSWLQATFCVLVISSRGGTHILYL
jgi:hypothetical protein